MINKLKEIFTIINLALIAIILFANLWQWMGRDIETRVQRNHGEKINLIEENAKHYNKNLTLNEIDDIAALDTDLTFEW